LITNVVAGKEPPSAAVVGKAGAVVIVRDEPT
jgi:hypothetical protein